MEQLNENRLNEEDQTETPSLPEVHRGLSQEEEDYIRWSGDGGNNLD